MQTMISVIGQSFWKIAFILKTQELHLEKADFFVVDSVPMKVSYHDSEQDQILSFIEKLQKSP